MSDGYENTGSRAKIALIGYFLAVSAAAVPSILVEPEIVGGLSFTAVVLGAVLMAYAGKWDGDIGTERYDDSLNSGGE